VRFPKNGLSLLLAIAIAAAGTAAQNDTIRVSTKLVQVNVVVRDNNGPVQGLKASGVAGPSPLSRRAESYQTSSISPAVRRTALPSFCSIC